MLLLESKVFCVGGFLRMAVRESQRLLSVGEVHCFQCFVEMFLCVSKMGSHIEMLDRGKGFE